MMFEDRETAAGTLAKKLRAYQGKNPLVLGIPRGGICTAKVIAEELDGELGAVLVQKIAFPANKEFAIACVGISGQIQRMPHAQDFEVAATYLKTAADEQVANLKRRKEKYGLVDYEYKDRDVIVVDDGIATGATTSCAVHEVKSHHPRRIILASPVCSRNADHLLRPLVDELVTLGEPKNFMAVSEYYMSFPQVTDEQVIELLNTARRDRLTG